MNDAGGGSGSVRCRCRCPSSSNCVCVGPLLNREYSAVSHTDTTVSIDSVQFRRVVAWTVTSCSWAACAFTCLPGVTYHPGVLIVVARTVPVRFSPSCYAEHSMPHLGTMTTTTTVEPSCVGSNMIRMQEDFQTPPELFLFLCRHPPP